MNHDLICDWFGLPKTVWPPDHYRLLALEPGEADINVIEQQVHQRYNTVRPYQMMHPEQATEAMNRLALAFVCLTDPQAKKDYDEQLLGPREKPQVAPPTPPTPPTLVVVSQPPPLPASDPLEWLYTPGANGPGETPIQTKGTQPPPLPTPPPPKTPPLEVKPPEKPTPVVTVPAEPVDAVLEAAQRSPQARSGLLTRRNYYRRILLTRHLQRLWHRLGRYLRVAEQKWSKEDAREVYKLIKQIEEAIENFPHLGEAGQPGYLIVSLVNIEKTRTLVNLTREQRESLQRDWSAGLKFLEAHRDFLRGQLPVLRRHNLFTRMIIGIRASINEQPLTVLLILTGLLALVLAFARWMME